MPTSPLSATILTSRPRPASGRYASSRQRNSSRRSHRQAMWDLTARSVPPALRSPSGWWRRAARAWPRSAPTGSPTRTPISPPCSPPWPTSSCVSPTPMTSERACPPERLSALNRFRDRAGDDPRPLGAAAAEEARRPAQHHDEAVLVADQVPDVNPKPDQPGREATEADEAEVRDGAPPSDRGQVALVDVAKRLGLFTAEPAFDRRRGVRALLNRHGRQPGEIAHPAVAIADLRHVAEGDHLGMTGQGEVRGHGHAARLVDLRTRLLPKLGGQLRGPDPGRPAWGAVGCGDR